MSKFKKLSRTDISAIISVLLFSITILVSSGGPLAAQEAQAATPSLANGETTSPTVISANQGYSA